MNRASIAPQPRAEARGLIDIRPHQILSIIRRREARARYFPAGLFSEPAWDILLDLAYARLAGEPPRLRATDSVVARWLAALIDEGLAVREGETVSLSDAGLSAIDAWLHNGAR